MSDRRSLTRFSDRAQAYTSHRPDYPPGVFEALFEGLDDPRTLHVADVGAGTGISSQQLAQRVASVVAIEPNAQMRERAAPLANVRWIDGTAENTGLADFAVDVAAAFQAFHWFDPQRAFQELSRVSRRRIGLVQYERDENQAFAAAYAAAIRPFMLDDTEALRLRTLETFASLAGSSLHRTVVPSTQTLDLEGVLGRASSSSYLPQSGAQAGELRERLRAIFREHEQGGVVPMAMSVYVLTADVTS